MGGHALLSPSSSKRWLECPPSVRLSEDIEDTTSVFAEEGTEAHALCEYKVLKALGIDIPDPRPEMQYLDSNMEEYSDGYRDFIMEIVESEKKEGRNPEVFIEEKLDMSRYVPECFGTGDCIIVSGNRLFIIDFKYGQGVPVSAVGNTQMRIYALGAIDLYSFIYDLEEVEMTIYQPRISNIDTDVMSVKDLLSWAEKYLVPRAKLAFDGEGDLNPGEWCRFCKVKATCKARAAENMMLARFEFRKANLLTDEEVAKVLEKIEPLVSWASDVKDYAMAILLEGRSLPGWKLVEGRATRKFKDEGKVAEAVKAAGFDPYEQKLKTITAMTGLLGKTRFNEILGDLVTRSKGKPTMVVETDKRPALAISDFSEFKEE